MHLDPMPGMGMLIAGLALVTMLVGYWPIRSEKEERIPAFLISIVLVLGALSLLYGLAKWGFETIYRVQSSEGGHSRPGELIFRVSYGLLSVFSFKIFHTWVRKYGKS